MATANPKALPSAARESGATVDLLMSCAHHTHPAWPCFNPLTNTYDTPDGTRVAAELCDNVQCLADVLRIAQLRDEQRAVIANRANN